MLAAALLVGAAWSPTVAEAPSLAALLAPLEARGYPSGTVAPAFAGLALDRSPVSTASLRGKVVVVNFWASWCRECRSEMPGLERLHRRFADRGLAVVGVNLREGRETVRRYAEHHGLSFVLVLDSSGTINRRYGVIGLPTTFIVGRDGRAVALAVGERDWQGPAAVALIERLLDEAAPGPR